MAKTGGIFRNLLVWTHERGTLQYDIICALILAFIFFVPRSCFTAKRQDTSQKTHIETSHAVQPNPAQHQ